MKKDISLYLHIPFCVKKCNYCDFLSFGGCSHKDMKTYVEALCREIYAYKEVGSGQRVISIFIGGGTPSLLELEDMEAIFHALNSVWEIASFAETTIEANPGTVTLKNLIGYRQLGINRISFGLQSANRQELELLGRIHTYEKFVASFQWAREAGFQNINVDLMFGIPGQTLESFRHTLSKILKLKPEHISAYSLIVEEGTPFYENEAILSMVPDEDTEQKMYRHMKTMLRGYGYGQYEISNYSLKGYECEHNQVYWKCQEYLGFGLGAASYYEGYRFHNVVDYEMYLETLQSGKTAMDLIETLRQDIELIDQNKAMEEYMFLGLRMMQGVSIAEFQRRFGNTIQQIYEQAIATNVERGLLELEGDYLRLSEKGIWLSNQVMADFIL